MNGFIPGLPFIACEGTHLVGTLDTAAANLLALLSGCTQGHNE